MARSDPTEFGRLLAEAHDAMEAAYRLGGVPAALAVYEGMAVDLTLVAESCGFNGYDAAAVVYSRCRHKLRSLIQGG